MTRARQLAVIFALATAVGSGCAPARSALPFYQTADFAPQWRPTSHRVGGFSLITQAGAPITSADLSGRVYVASFIYTRCAAVCPLLVSNLKKVQSAVGDRDDVSILSFSVTPELDPPDVLASFGREQGIDPARWTLVTGSKSEIYRLARDSYFASDSRLELETDAAEAFLHTEKLILVDQKGRLRGVYNGTQPFEIEHLVDDIRLLTGHPGL